MNMLLETRHAARLNSRVVHSHLQLVNIELIMDLNYSLNILSEATCCKNQPLRVISMYGEMISINEVAFS